MSRWYGEVGKGSKQGDGMACDYSFLQLRGRQVLTLHKGVVRHVCLIL